MPKFACLHVLPVLAFVALLAGCSGGDDNGGAGAAGDDGSAMLDAPSGDDVTIDSTAEAAKDDGPDAAGDVLDAPTEHDAAQDGAIDAGSDALDAAMDSADASSCDGPCPPPPSWPTGSALVAAPTGDTSALLAWTPASDPVGVTFYEIVENGAVVSAIVGTTTSYVLNGLTPNKTYSLQVQATNAGGTYTTSGPTTTLVAQKRTPAAPSPPPLDLTVPTNMASEARFLYTGQSPLQVDISATIAPERIAILRGRVIDTKGAAMAGVAVTIADHPEYGYTNTRADGAYDLAANGGGYLTLSFRAQGFGAAQRTVQVPWQRFVPVADVALVVPDSVATSVDLSGASALQVARASVVTDSDGTRQATLIFAGGTQGQMTLPDGTTQNLSTAHVRATEVTVGPNGPAAMPAELPATTGYTYAVGLTIDEAEHANATRVSFSTPVAAYLENFLGFSVGVVVPSGYYDEAKHQWIASKDGRVIKVLTTGGGSATIDVDGSGQAASSAQLTALGITGDELAQIAVLYTAGQALWRVPVAHFSCWDFNTGFAPAAGAAAPSDSPPPSPNTDNGPECPGCIIGVTGQTLGERVPVGGTPFSLNYRSSRTPGYGADFQLTIPLTGATPPSPLIGVDLEVDIAGEQFTKSFGPQANQGYTYTWDGKDTYGRTQQGLQPVTVRVGYVYRGVPLSASNPPNLTNYDQEFGHFTYYGAPATTSNLGGTRTITLWHEWTGYLGHDNLVGIGGWDLNVHHVYDHGTIRYGDGRRRTADTTGPIVETVAGNGTDGSSGDNGPATSAQIRLGPHSVAVGPDGSIYLGDDCRVRKVTPDGIITTAVGSGQCGWAGDGGSATSALLEHVDSIAFGPDGSLYIEAGPRIRRVDPAGIMHTFAGSGTYSANVDGVQALSAGLAGGGKIAIAPDGTVYVMDSGFLYKASDRLLQIGTDGYVRLVTSVRSNTGAAPDGPLSTAYLGGNGRPIAVGPDGTLYVADVRPLEHSYLRSISPGGAFTTFAGQGEGNNDNGYELFYGSWLGIGKDGDLANAVSLGWMIDLAAGPDGTVYYSVGGSQNNFIRAILPDHHVALIAGGYPPSGAAPDTEGSLAAGTGLPVNGAVGLTLGPDGSLYFSEPSTARIRRVRPSIRGNVAGGFTFADAGGREVYFFDGAGRHLKTVDALTGATLYQFGYDNAGLLVTVTDVSGDVTQITRDSKGNPTGIASAFGQKTTIAVDGNGHLSTIKDAAGDAYTFVTGSSGLVQSIKRPNGGANSYTYDSAGRLIQDVDPAGGGSTLSSQSTMTGAIVARTTAMGLVSTFAVDKAPGGDTQLTITGHDGLTSTERRSPSDVQTSLLPDGTVVTTTMTADPRFGTQSRYESSVTVAIPGGLTSTKTTQRTVTLSNPVDPLSLKTLTTTTAINGNKWAAAFDAGAHTMTVTSPAGRQAVTTVDSAGRPTQVSVPNINPFVTAYDAHGRIASLTQGSRTWGYGYDAQSHLASTTDPLSHATSFTNDAIGRPTLIALPDGRKIGSAYDADSNVSSLTLPSGQVHGFAYTPVDLTSSYQPPILGVGTWSTSYAFDLDRRPTTESRPGAVTLSSSYDSAGRLASVAYPQGTLSYFYDSKTGLLASASASGGETTAYAYAGFLRAGVTWSGPVAGSLSLGLDSNFRVTNQTVNGSSLTFDYDADGLLTQAGALALTLDAHNGLLTGTTLNSITDSYARDANGQLATYTASYSGSPIYSESINMRDALGRITQRTETVAGTAHVWGYTYDKAGRLTDVTFDGNFASHYAYDPDDNRTTFTNGSGTVNPAYDAQDRLKTYGGTSYTFAPNGELVSKTDSSGTTKYVYSAFGELLSVTKPNGTLIEYVHDPEHRRVGKKLNGALTKAWLYDGQLKIVAELDGAMNLGSRFVQAGGANGADYMVKGGNTYRLVRDHLGSIRLVVDANAGTVAQQIDYDEFGVVTNDTNPGFQPFGFAGGLYDPDTGLVRFGARDYDASVGRWTGKDPIRFEGGSLNIYEYVGNEPVDRVDPRGTFGGCDAGGIAACFYVCPYFGLAEGLPGLACALVCGFHATVICEPDPPAERHPAQNDDDCDTATARPSVSCDPGIQSCQDPDDPGLPALHEPQ